MPLNDEVLKDENFCGVSVPAKVTNNQYGVVGGVLGHAGSHKPAYAITARQKEPRHEKWRLHL